jgi:hypothetical protein
MEAAARLLQAYIHIPHWQYFETMRGAPRDGNVQKQYYDFSLKSARAAQVGGRVEPSKPAVVNVYCTNFVGDIVGCVWLED